MPGIQKLLDGYENFRSTVFPQKCAHYGEMSKGQSPDFLLITCCDSRVLPHEFTCTTEGDIFENRSLGNIIPVADAGQIETTAVIEYAVIKLRVKHIIVCGHTDCGAMKGLLNPAALADVPAVAAWLLNAQETLEVVRKKYPHLEGPELLDATVHENVLVQLDRLRRVPSVAKRLASAELFLHGWVFEIEKGQVVEFDPRVGKFVPLPEAHRPTAS